MRQAKHPLERVFKLIEEEKFWFSAPTRSTAEVIKFYRKFGEHWTIEETQEFILNGILALTETDYCESIIQWNDVKCVADVYGLIFEGHAWYVKFLIDESGELEEISFHPPERAMKTVNGKVIP